MVGGIIDSAVTVLAAFGGAGVVGAAAAKFISEHTSKELLQQHKGELDTLLESHKAMLQREADQHRLSLKRQEFLFGREIEAADALIKLHRRLYPAYSHPDMDWSDASEAVAMRLEQIEEDMENFLEAHSAVLTEGVRTKVEEIRNLATDAKFHVQGVPGDLDNQSLATGGQILEKLNEAKDQVLKDLRR